MFVHLLEILLVSDGYQHACLQKI